MSSYDRACLLGAMDWEFASPWWYVPLDWDSLWDPSMIPESVTAVGPRL